MVVVRAWAPKRKLKEVSRISMCSRHRPGARLSLFQHSHRHAHTQVGRSWSQTPEPRQRLPKGGGGTTNRGPFKGTYRLMCINTRGEKAKATHLGSTALGKLLHMWFAHFSQTLSYSFYQKHLQGASLTSFKPCKRNSSASLKPIKGSTSTSYLFLTKYRS